jgi:hypothetical protein
VQLINELLSESHLPNYLPFGRKLQTAEKQELLQVDFCPEGAEYQ